MAWSGGDLERATEAARGLLEELHLEAYLFALEPREGDWELKLECAFEEGWQTITLPVEVELLLASRKDSAVRARLLQSWTGRLAACLKTTDRESSVEGASHA
jgi:hypothetical protein